jgi:hypothetical protein
MDNPYHDPAFQSRVVWDLCTHVGEWRPLGRLYAGELESFDRCRLVGRVVARARRLGFVIDGDRQRGYRLRDFVMPAAIYAKPGRTRRPVTPQPRRRS